MSTPIIRCRSSLASPDVTPASPAPAQMRSAIEPELYTLSDTAILLALSEATLFRMRKAGTLQTLRIGGRVFVERDEIERIKDAGRKAAKPRH